MTRKESRNAPVPKSVLHTTDYTPVDKAILQRNELHEGSQKLKIPYAGPKPQTQCIDFGMTEYVIHWTRTVSLLIMLAAGLVNNGWKIRETRFTPFEVKNEIVFHRVVVNHNQLTNSPQYDAVKVRSNAKIRTPFSKEVGTVINLSTLVETLPNKVFPTPSGILVASHGPNVEDNAKRLVIPVNQFHAIQIGTKMQTQTLESAIPTERAFEERLVRLGQPDSRTAPNSECFDTGHQNSAPVREGTHDELQ